MRLTLNEEYYNGLLLFQLTRIMWRRRWRRIPENSRNVNWPTPSTTTYPIGRAYSNLSRGILCTRMNQSSAPSKVRRMGSLLTKRFPNVDKINETSNFSLTVLRRSGINTKIADHIIPRQYFIVTNFAS